MAARSERGFRGLFDRLAALLRRQGAMRARTADQDARLQLITENMADMILWLDGDFRCRYASAASRDVIGFAPEELLGSAIDELVADADRPAFEALREKLQAGEAAAEAIFRCRRRTGEQVWLEARARLVGGGGGVVLAVRDIGHIIEHATRAERRLAETNQQLEQLNQALEAQALQDSLTGLANRRRFDRTLDEEFRRAMRAHGSLALVMIDVDLFKSYNDTYGHQAGDACLRMVCETVAGITRRPADLVARYGGEEIAALLPGIDTAGAVTVAQRMVDAVRACQWPHLDNPRGVVTVSAGVTVALPMKDFHTPSDLVWTADMALYEAKSAGRDCVRAGPDLSKPPLRMVGRI
jgi:diguanylate cyclase (GGDEF)-like protein/PAS domain S-box-containing protein